eukprot:GHVN01066595.1.p1 GENE.GHVN01066595.1~~GHVN01066595.1.p1  ORF type:complete len:4018 (+),score=834.70 GHVN01066595.1:200-12055(+)
MLPACKAIILAFYGAALVMSVIWALQLKQGLDLKLLSLPTSQLPNYYDAFDTHFPNGLETRVAFWNASATEMSEEGESVNWEAVYSSEEFIKVMNDLMSRAPLNGDDEIAEREEGEGGGERKGVPVNFAAPFGNTLKGSPIDIPLGQWLAISGAETFIVDMGFDSAKVKSSGLDERVEVITQGKGPQSVKAHMLLDVKLGGRDMSIKQKEAMLAVRDFFDNEAPSDIIAVATSTPFRYFEQYVVILSTTLRNMALAVGAVFLACMLLTGSLSLSILTVLGVISVDILLLGMMYLWDIALDSISGVNLVMAIGLSADYIIHTSHDIIRPADPAAYFMSPDDRVRRAIEHTGSAVLAGGVSTFLGVMPTAFAKSHVFKMFFKMFVGICLFALAHGLVIIPVILSLVLRCCTLDDASKKSVSKDRFEAEERYRDTLDGYLQGAGGGSQLMRGPGMSTTSMAGAGAGEGSNGAQRKNGNGVVSTISNSSRSGPPHQTSRKWFGWGSKTGAGEGLRQSSHFERGLIEIETTSPGMSSPNFIASPPSVSDPLLKGVGGVGGTATTDTATYQSRDGETRRKPGKIAVVGIACHFPQCRDKREFWEVLKKGDSTVSEYPKDRPFERFWMEQLYSGERSRPCRIYTKRGAFVSDVDKFDNEFFGVPAQEANSMDPQHRFLLEQSYLAIHDSGIPLQKLQVPQRTGIFVGVMNIDYHGNLVDESYRSYTDQFFVTAGTKSIASGRIAYALNITGPTMTFDTACSSSLTAASVAAHYLNLKIIDYAIVGGVNLLLDWKFWLVACKADMMARDGRCKTFDASVDGYGRGEGCGVVVLRRLEDSLKGRDRVYSVIVGHAANNDGRTAVPITAPGEQMQYLLATEVCAQAGIVPDQVKYIEAHGTGTPVGDLTEVKALTRAYGPGRTLGPIPIGSAKAVFNHTESAAGVMSLIKACLIINKNQLPPIHSVRVPNPKLDFAKESLVVQDVLSRHSFGEGDTVVVNNFGYGGSSVHMALQPAPKIQVKADQEVKMAGSGMSVSGTPQQSLADLNEVCEDVSIVFSAPTIGGLQAWASTVADYCHSLSERGYKGALGHGPFHGPHSPSSSIPSPSPPNSQSVTQSDASSSHLLSAMSLSPPVAPASNSFSPVLTSTKSTYLSPGQNASLSPSPSSLILSQQSEMVVSPLVSLAHTLNTRASVFAFRLGIVVKDLRHARHLLAEFSSKGAGAANSADGAQHLTSGRVAAAPPKVAFIFGGQGTQWHGMGASLYQQIPAVKRLYRQIDEHLVEIGCPHSLITSLDQPQDSSPMYSTLFGQLGMFAVQVAVSICLKDWGVVPVAVAGHSLGEIGAAYFCGAISLKDAVLSLYSRATLQDERCSGKGAMAAAELTEEQAHELLKEAGISPGTIEIAAFNDYSNVTLSGDKESMDVFLKHLSENKPKLFVRKLGVNCAFHSHQMDCIRGDYLEATKNTGGLPVQIPFYSTVDPNIDPLSIKLDNQYFWKNIRQPVRFTGGVSRLINETDADTFVEIGAQPALGRYLQTIYTTNRSRGDGPSIVPVLPRQKIKNDFINPSPSEAVSLHLTALKLWATGCTGVDLGRVSSSQEGCFLELPPYPFACRRFWLDNFITSSLNSTESDNVIQLTDEKGDQAEASEVGQSIATSTQDDFTKRRLRALSVIGDRHRSQAYHPLLGPVAPSPFGSNEMRWETIIDLDKTPYLRDHSLKIAGGSPVFPAAGYVEMVLAAMRDVGLSNSVCLEKVRFHKLLVIDEGELPRLRLTVNFDPINPSYAGCNIATLKGGAGIAAEPTVHFSTNCSLDLAPSCGSKEVMSAVEASKKRRTSQAGEFGDVSEMRGSIKGYLSQQQQDSMARLLVDSDTSFRLPLNSDGSLVAPGQDGVPVSVAEVIDAPNSVSFDESTVYDALTSAGFIYGAAFQSIKLAWFAPSKRSAALFIDLTSPALPQVSDPRYVLSPSLMDSCLQGVVLFTLNNHLNGLQQGDDDDDKVPFEVDRVSLIRRPTEKSAWSVIRQRDHDSDVYDISLLNTAGQLLACWEGFALAAAGSELVRSGHTSTVQSMFDPKLNFHLEYTPLDIPVESPRFPDQPDVIIVDLMKTGEGDSLSVQVMNRLKEEMGFDKVTIKYLIEDSPRSEDKIEPSQWWKSDKLMGEGINFSDLWESAIEEATWKGSNGPTIIIYTGVLQATTLPVTSLTAPAGTRIAFEIVIGMLKVMLKHKLPLKEEMKTVTHNNAEADFVWRFSPHCVVLTDKGTSLCGGSMFDANEVMGINSLSEKEVCNRLMRQHGGVNDEEGDKTDSMHPYAALAWGVHKVMCIEHDTDARLSTIDIDKSEFGDPTSKSLMTLMLQLSVDSPERSVSIRHGQRYVPRLRHQKFDRPDSTPIDLISTLTPITRTTITQGVSYAVVEASALPVPTGPVSDLKMISEKEKGSNGPSVTPPQSIQVLTAQTGSSVTSPPTTASSPSPVGCFEEDAVCCLVECPAAGYVMPNHVEVSVSSWKPSQHHILKFMGPSSPSHLSDMTDRPVVGFMGVVTRLGEGVADSFTVGERVVGLACRRVLTSYITVPCGLLLNCNALTSLDVLADPPAACVTIIPTFTFAYHILSSLPDPQSSSIMVVGEGGELGMCITAVAEQVCRYVMGASEDINANLSLEWPACRTFLCVDSMDFDKSVLSATDGMGVDVVIFLQGSRVMASRVSRVLSVRGSWIDVLNDPNPRLSSFSKSVGLTHPKEYTGTIVSGGVESVTALNALQQQHQRFVAMPSAGTVYHRIDLSKLVESNHNLCHSVWSSHITHNASTGHGGQSHKANTFSVCHYLLMRTMPFWLNSKIVSLPLSKVTRHGIPADWVMSNHGRFVQLIASTNGCDRNTDHNSIQPPSVNYVPRTYKHTGTQQLDDSSVTPIFQAPNIGLSSHPSHLREDMTYLVVGGTRGFGLHVAHWLIAKGGRYVVLTSRSLPPRNHPDRASFRRLHQAAGVRVEYAAADFTNRDSMRDLLALFSPIAKRKVVPVPEEPNCESDGNDIGSLPPIAGIVLSPMVLKDEAIVDLTMTNALDVIKTKMHGTIMLIELLRELNVCLDFLLLFSSMTAVLGNMKQAAYSAANSFMDVYAFHLNWASLNGRGLPGSDTGTPDGSGPPPVVRRAVSFNWGPISGAGVLTRNVRNVAYFSSIGFGLVRADECCSSVDAVMRCSTTSRCVQTMVGRYDWVKVGKAFPSLVNIIEELIAEAQQASGRGDPDDLLTIQQKLAKCSTSEERRVALEPYVAELINLTLQPGEEIDTIRSFQDYGLDSLTKSMLPARIARDLNVTIPLEFFTRADACISLTVDALIQALDSLESSNDTGTGSRRLPPFIVPFHIAEFPTASLFVVHPSHRPVYSLQHLSKCFEAQSHISFYAIGSSDPMELSKPWKSVEVLASRYVDAVVAVQPRGPYFIAGYSYGGAIAVAMCLMLEKRGSEVALCGMIDSVAAVSAHYESARGIMHQVLYRVAVRQVNIVVAQFLSRLAADKLGVPQSTVDRIERMDPTEGGEEIRKIVSDESVRQGKSFLLPDIERFRQSVAADTICATRTHLEYRPGVHKVSIPITYIKAKDERFKFDLPLLPAAEVTWGELSKHRNRLDLYVVPGHHYNMVDQKRAPNVARLLLGAVMSRISFHRPAPSPSLLPDATKVVPPAKSFVPAADRHGAIVQMLLGRGLPVLLFSSKSYKSVRRGRLTVVASNRQQANTAGSQAPRSSASLSTRTNATWPSLVFTQTPADVPHLASASVDTVGGSNASREGSVSGVEGTRKQMIRKVIPIDTSMLNVIESRFSPTMPTRSGGKGMMAINSEAGTSGPRFASEWLDSRMLDQSSQPGSQDTSEVYGSAANMSVAKGVAMHGFAVVTCRRAYHFLVEALWVSPSEVRGVNEIENGTEWSSQPTDAHYNVSEGGGEVVREAAQVGGAVTGEAVVSSLMKVVHDVRCAHTVQRE